MPQDVSFFENQPDLLLLPQKRLVTTQTIYYMPDHPAVLNEFVWQLEDLVPDLPRFMQFLEYWRKHVKARIKLIEVAYPDMQRPPSFQHADILLRLQ